MHIHTCPGHSPGHMSVLTWVAYVCADLGVQCAPIVCICMYMHVYACICKYMQVYVRICMYIMYMYVLLVYVGICM
jgi:hypothetical protein